MSEPTPCSCRVPWIVALIALGVVIADRFIVAAMSRTAAVPPAPAVAAPTPAPADTPRLATLQQELADTRRVLDDAQSALAQRDREIATANDDLRVLRLELDALRTKNATPAP